MLASSQVVFYDQVSCSYKQLLFFFICLVFLYLSQFCFQNAVLDLSDFQHIFFKCSYINNPPIPLVFFFSGVLPLWTGSVLAWCMAIFSRVSLAFSRVCFLISTVTFTFGLLPSFAGAHSLVAYSERIFGRYMCEKIYSLTGLILRI